MMRHDSEFGLAFDGAGRVLVAAVAFFCAAAGRADDPYVEFTGTQSVDTGYTVTAETAVVADFQMTDTATTQQLVWSAGANMGSRLYINNGKQWSWTCFDAYGDNVSTGLDVDGDRLTVRVDGFTRTVTVRKHAAADVLYAYGPESGWSKLSGTKTSENTLKIGSRFAANNGAWSYAAMKLYGFQIYEAGELVRDYIPAVRDGVTGLYDRQNGGFIYDARLSMEVEQTLGAGGTLPVIDDPYLESTGGAGLNARMVASADMRAEVEFAFVDTTTADQRVFGWNSRPSFYISGQFNQFAFTVGAGAATKTVPVTPDTARHTAVLDYAGKTLALRTGDATVYSRTFSEDTAPEDGKPTPVALFANTENETYTGLRFKHPAKVKIYRARFWRAGQLVHDYRPCVKGDVPGLRDHVDGAFVCGENVAAFRTGGSGVETIPDDGYVELTGNNQESGTGKWIDTGYYPGPKTRLAFDYALADNYTGKVGTGEWWHLSDYTPASGSLPAERLNFSSTDAATFRWRTGTGDFLIANQEVGAPTAQRGIRRQILFDAAEGTYSLVTAGYTNFTAVSETKISRVFARSLRIGGNTDFPPICSSPLRIYGLKIYEDDVLLHDFQPKVVNGVPGLWDAQTGAFTANAESTTSPLLGCGGAIATDADSKDAYLEFTGAQSIDTGFKPTASTALVADLQLTDTTANPQQFVWSSNEMTLRLYTTLQDKKFGWFCHNSNAGGVVTSVALDAERLTVTLDGANQVATLVRNGETIYAYDGAWKANDNICTSTLRIGSRFAEGSAGWCFTRMKLYGLKIYEAGELIRDYVPYVQDGVAGLYDKRNGTFAPDAIGTEAFKIGGIGAPFALLADTTVTRNREKTLDGRTVGAVGYQWFVNGEAVAGATEATFAVAWRSGGTDVVSVTPYFDVFGVRTAGAAMSATVTSVSDGTTVILR